MIALLEEYDLDDACRWRVAGIRREPTVNSRAELAAKRHRSGRQRLATEARYSRRRGDGFQGTSRQRPRKAVLCTLA